VNTRARRWLFGAVVLAGIALWLFEGELAIAVANLRPDAEAARLIDRLAISNGDAIAEIGAGAGRLTVAVAKALPASRIYSTELSPTQLTAIRAAVAEDSLRNVEIREAALEGTNLPDACCDAIFMRTVYHHFTSPPKMVAAIHRALKPGGRLAIIDFEPSGIWKWLAVPDDTPNRGGHGVPREMLIGEVTRSAGFRYRSSVPRWAGRLYFVLFERDQR
jgi:ubiquinone/menaquinone biosynthesis C-methylase UbiE